MMLSAETIQTALAPEDGRNRYEQLEGEVATTRERPLLVAFYPPDASIREMQIDQLYAALRETGLHHAEPVDRLDVLLHTAGGEPTAAYRLAQVIRDFAKRVTFLVPYYAYSAGTLMCLSANQISLGANAVLSPMDITLVTERTINEEDEHDLFPDEDPAGEVETVAIDYFIQVAKQARMVIEGAFRRKGWKSSTTDVESAMLTEMTRQLGVLAIAKYYREKNTTQAYAEELLRYMVGSGPSAKARIRKILRQLIVEAPSHEFPMDYHICLDIGLNVVEMPEPLSDATREIARVLGQLAYAGNICKPVHGVRLPFFHYCPFAGETNQAIAMTKEAAIEDKDDGPEQNKREPAGSRKQRGE